MGEAAGPTVGDLPQLGELLALLHRADAPFDSVEATYRIWRHEERSSDAWRAQIEEQKRRDAGISSFSLRGDSDRPAETERVLRIWRAEGRVREEHEGGARGGAYVVRDGDAWWLWDDGIGAKSNQGDLTLGYGDGGECLVDVESHAAARGPEIYAHWTRKSGRPQDDHCRRGPAAVGSAPSPSRV